MKQKLIESGKRIALAVAIYGTALGGCGSCVTSIIGERSHYQTQAPYHVTDMQTRNSYNPINHNGNSNGTRYAIKVGPRVVLVTRDNLQFGMSDGLGFASVKENPKYGERLERFANEPNGGAYVKDHGIARKLTPENLLVSREGLDMFMPAAKYR